MHALTRSARSLLLIAPVLLWGCDDVAPPTGIETPSAATLQSGETPAPAGLVTIPAAGGTLQIWPYTDTNFEGTPLDPINLVFLGVYDPRNVRDALMAVDGSRAGPFAPFNCTWTDAIGTQQTSYAATSGWTGSSIQLECGSYTSIRFHLRLFPVEGGTMGNAHIDVLVPGTTDHRVLTWELGEQFVTYDLARTGQLSAAPAQASGVNEAPTFGDIPTVIYNGLPASLRALTGGPLSGNVSTPVGIPTNGSATILSLVDAPAAGGTQQNLVINFGQTIPKPFCDAGNQYVRVDGPVFLRQTVDVSKSGVMTSETIIEGELAVRSVNVLTGEIGEPARAHVRDHYHTMNRDGASSVFSTRHQQLHVPKSGPQQLREQLQVGTRGHEKFQSEQKCR